jgi:hypothetical protein
MEQAALNELKAHFERTSPGMKASGDICAKAFVMTVGALLKHIEERERYHDLLTRAIRNAKQPQL